MSKCDSLYLKEVEDAEDKRGCRGFSLQSRTISGDHDVNQYRRALALSHAAGKTVLAIGGPAAKVGRGVWEGPDQVHFLPGLLPVRGSECRYPGDSSPCHIA